MCRRARAWLCAAKASSNAGAYLIYLDKPVEALRAGEEAARLFALAGDPGAATQSRYNMAVVRSGMGDAVGSLADLDAADPYKRPSATGVFPGLWHAGRALALLELGRNAEALDEAQKAVAIGRGRPDKYNIASFRAEAWRALSKAQAAMNLPQDALASARRGLAEASMAARSDLTLARFQTADILLSNGRTHEALPLVEAGLEGLQEFRSREQAEQLFVAAKVFASSGDEERAVELLSRAYEALDESARFASSALTSDAMTRVVVADREAEAARLVAANARRAAVDAQQIANYRVGASIALALGLLAAATGWFRGRAAQARHRAEALLAERTRVAGEVHDTLLAGFAAVVQQIDLSREALEADSNIAPAALAKAAALARSQLADAREAVWDLRDPVNGASLASAIRKAAAEIPGGAATMLGLTVTGEPARLPATLAAALLRVAREAMINAVRHGAATRIEIALDVAPQSARISVADDGTGFVVEPERTAMGGNWGILGMRERMERIGGTLTLASVLGEGAVVVAEAPL